ncbi:MAG: hypothetical protein K2I61_01255 [Muribaculaceae bacterium]|nr:hypothetical protein [Muribaculaceae bacterium]
MEENTNTGRRVPLWMLAIIILCALPGVSFPLMGNLLASGNITIEGLTWFYPLYTIASAMLAWQCYGRRTLMCWIILALLLLSHLCFFYLACTIGGQANYR